MDIIKHALEGSVFGSNELQAVLVKYPILATTLEKNQMITNFEILVLL